MRIFHFTKGFSISFPLLLLLFPVSTFAQDAQESLGDTTGIKLRFHEQNERCLHCHGSPGYTYHNKVSNREVKARMSDSMVISRGEFYIANHKSFACTDCHSASYDTFPHPAELRLETQYNCIDCHGNDEKFAKFHFEEIEAEFKQSVHFIAKADAFTCWKCHDPHSYKISIRDSKDITKSIAYDNQICLNCHSDFKKSGFPTGSKETNILQSHQWLPNQALHFSQVRCIDCHARLNDSLMVAHGILPKDKAVKRCVECHSQNTLLVSSLYKFRSQENRTRAGFLNAVILNNAFVIGANRNILLNRVSIILFSVITVLLFIHFLLIRYYKKRG